MIEDLKKELWEILDRTRGIVPIGDQLPEWLKTGGTFRERRERLQVWLATVGAGYSREGGEFLSTAEVAAFMAKLGAVGGGSSILDPACGVGLARPGGNVTGLSSLSFTLNTKRLEILKDAVPKLARVGYLLLEGGGGSLAIARDLELNELRPAATALNLKLEELETQLDAKVLESAFQTAKQRQVGAIMPSPNPRFFGERKWIVELAGKYRLPAIYPRKEFVDEGGLMSYAADSDDVFRRAAVYVDKILKGAKPADLPVQQAAKFEFVVNLKAAKQIGLTIPVRVLERANQVIR